MDKDVVCAHMYMDTHTHTHINRIVSHWHINSLVWLSNEYYSAIKNEIIPFAATWMDRDDHTK